MFLSVHLQLAQLNSTSYSMLQLALQDCLYARTSGLTVKDECVVPPPGPAYFLFKFCYAASSTIPLGIITCIITDQSQSLLHHHLQIIIITIIGMIVVIRKSVSLLFTIIRS